MIGREKVENNAQEFSFDKGILDNLDTKSKIQTQKSHNSKKVDYGRASQFKGRKKNLNYSLSPQPHSGEPYPSLHDIRKNINEKNIGPESVHQYSNQLYNLHTVHTNMLNFLATERENMTQKFTHQPKITYKGRHMFEDSDKTVVDRSEAWIDRRKQKLENLKQRTLETQQKELQMTMTQHIRPEYKQKPDIESKVKVYMQDPIVDTRRIQNDAHTQTHSQGKEKTLQTVYLATTGDIANFLKQGK